MEQVCLTGRLSLNERHADGLYGEWTRGKGRSMKEAIGSDGRTRLEAGKSIAFGQLGLDQKRSGQNEGART